jgi:hypothetical protein
MNPGDDEEDAKIEHETVSKVSREKADESKGFSHDDKSSPAEPDRSAGRGEHD